MRQPAHVRYRRGIIQPMSEPDRPPLQAPRRVLLFGASGSIGRATQAALVAAGYEAVAVVRRRASERASAHASGHAPGEAVPAPSAVALMQTRIADVTNAESLARDAFCGERFDAVISCLASRSGAPDDAWAIDHAAHQMILAESQRSGVTHFVLLSAICVQKPRLAFQFAKLAFEDALRASGVRYSIVRPTAYFKSLSGQVERVRRGKPFLVFGDGALTRCTPISDRDIAQYLVDCLRDESRWDRVLPIGGPGPALTPREQGALLFALTGRTPSYRSVPPGFLLAVARLLDVCGIVVPPLKAKAEFARIGHYYATESMLHWDAAAGRYDEAATPQYGRDTLREHYAQMLRGEVADDRGAHAVF